MMNSDIAFKKPEVLYLLIGLLPLLIWYIWKQKKVFASLQVSDTAVFSSINGGIRTKLRHLPFLLRLIGLLGLIVAIARPQSFDNWEDSSIKGIDIILANDISGSMNALDMNKRRDITRLQVAQNLASEFVDNRPNDNIGIVVFAGESLTPCPLTTDHTHIKRVIEEIDPTILKDGTAIGMGLATAVNRIKDSDAESKGVILLTDGVNNAGYVKPLTAAEIAKEFDIKVYTIGVGTEGQALAPTSRRSDGRYQFSLTRVEIDEGLLTQIAEMTGGKYFRATNAKRLELIYAEIDRLEKTEIEVTTVKRYSEEFYWFVGVGVLLLLFEILLRMTLLRKIN